MKKLINVLLFSASTMLFSNISRADTVICSGAYLLSTRQPVTLTLTDFGNGMGSCLVQDSFGRAVLNVTGNIHHILYDGQVGHFEPNGGGIEFKTADNYWNSCSFGYIAEGPRQGQITASWFASRDHYNTMLNTINAVCQRY